MQVRVRARLGACEAARSYGWYAPSRARVACSAGSQRNPVEGGARALSASSTYAQARGGESGAQRRLSTSSPRSLAPYPPRWLPPMTSQRSRTRPFQRRSAALGSAVPPAPAVRASTPATSSCCRRTGRSLWPRLRSTRQSARIYEPPEKSGTLRLHSRRKDRSNQLQHRLCLCQRHPGPGDPRPPTTGPRRRRPGPRPQQRRCLVPNPWPQAQRLTRRPPCCCTPRNALPCQLRPQPAISKCPSPQRHLCI